MASMMEIRRRVMDQATRIRVMWNNSEPPFSTDLYRPYDSSKSSLEDVSDGIVKQTWLNAGGGYSRTTRIKNVTRSVVLGHYYYLGYMINPSIGGMQIGAEYIGGRTFNGGTCPANTWTHLSVVDTCLKSGSYPVYYANYREGEGVYVGTYVLLKAPLLVDLTQMFGSGNEPTKAEFERQCAMNGIDLTASHTQDTTGTQRWWII